VACHVPFVGIYPFFKQPDCPIRGMYTFVMWLTSHCFTEKKTKINNYLNSVKRAKRFFKVKRQLLLHHSIKLFTLRDIIFHKKRFVDR